MKNPRWNPATRHWILGEPGNLLFVESRVSCRLPMTYAEAQQRYRAGNYTFSPPPVYSGAWNEQDWIFYIFGVKPEGR